MKSLFVLFLTQMVPAVAGWLKKKYLTVEKIKKHIRRKKK